MLKAKKGEDFQKPMMPLCKERKTLYAAPRPSKAWSPQTWVPVLPQSQLPCGFSQVAPAPPASLHLPEGLLGISKDTSNEGGCRAETGVLGLVEFCGKSGRNHTPVPANTCTPFGLLQ